MIWRYAYWQPQTNINNTLGSSSRERQSFRFYEIEEIRANKQISSGIEQTDVSRAIKSDTQNVSTMRSGDDIFFDNGEKRTVQDVRKKPSLRGGRSYVFTILLK